nr:patatin-like phospholipase family protein [uncultured Flavobacterium sp.]
MKTIAVLLKSVWLYLAGILSLVVIYVLLTTVEQGIDVVIQAGEYKCAAIATILGCILWAFLLWYSARILSYIKQEYDTVANCSGMVFKIPTTYHKHIPRLLAYNTFVCIQAAIISIPTGIDVHGWYLVLFLVLHNVLYFFLNQYFSGKKKYPIIVSVLLLIISEIIIFYKLFSKVHVDDVYEGYNRHLFWLPLIMLVLFVIQCFAVYLFINRRRFIDISLNDDDIPVTISTKVMKRFSLRQKYINSERKTFLIFMIISGCSFICYLAAIFSINVAVSVGALSYCLLAMGIIIGICNIITMVSIHKGINVFLLLYVVAFISGKFIDQYEVRTTTVKQGFSYGYKRPGTNLYLTNWFNERIKILKNNPTYKDSTKPFDVYFVLSNGGASRAGHWSGGILSELQKMSYEKDPTNTFKDHVLCLAGASGGTLGNTAFYALLNAEQNHTITASDFPRLNDNFFRRDFLTFALARMLGPDILRHILPFPIYFDNRGDVLERSFSEAPSKLISNESKDTILPYYYGRPLSEVLDYSGKLPVLFINTTEVQRSYPGVIGTIKPVRKDSIRKYKTDVLSKVDNLKWKDSVIDIRYSTAATLSARFPYVSPAVRVYDEYFVDGGYYDNSGAGTVLEFVHDLEEFMKTKAIEDIFKRRFTFHILHLTNSNAGLEWQENKKKIICPIEDIKNNRIHPLTNDLLAPLLTAVSTAETGTGFGDKILIDYMKTSYQSKPAYIKYSLYNRSAKDTFPYPMSWAISDFQFRRMSKARKREHELNLASFEFLKK